jgi:pSer/pThr/pTyr-binding forkhead associated (FHA) protein
MTTQDQNKKTLRHFQCRDYLWEIFEQMSAELECSTDYLINEAMRQYARSRNYGTSRRGASVSTQPPPSGSGNTPVTANVSAGAIPSLRDNAQPARSSAPLPPPRPSRSAQPAASAQRLQSSSMPPPPRAQQSARPTSSASMPPPLPGMNRTPAPQAPARYQLYVIFNGQKIPVTKDEFIIGRGSKSADLAIKDGNISRRHAAVVFHNGAYYMKDLGSTNGVEFQGRRFDSKRIEEGDLFRMCDYELRFTYQ